MSDVTADGVIKLSAGKKRHALVRPRGDYANLIAQDRLPDWLAPAEKEALAGA